MLEALKAENAERRQINAEAISAAQGRISLLEKERGIFQTNEQKLEAAAVKFSRLSDKDKVAALTAQQVAQAGGTLTKKQKESLEGLGLGEETEAVKRQDLDEARKAGFFDRFGAFEKNQQKDSLVRANDITSLQKQSQEVDQGATPEERQERLRALNLKQEQIGESQDLAARQRSFTPVASDQAFADKVQQVKVEIADRKDFVIKLEQNERAVAKVVADEVTRFERGAEERLRKLVTEESQKRKGEAVKQSQLEIAQRNASKPT